MVACHSIDNADMEVHMLVLVYAEAVNEGHRADVQACPVHIGRTGAARRQALRNQLQKDAQHHVQSVLILNVVVVHGQLPALCEARSQDR